MRLAPLILALAPLALATSATASPWLLRPGELVVVGRYDFETADREYLDSGGPQVYPLNGRLSSTTYAIDLRLGTLPDFELQIMVPIKVVSYTADPVILLDDQGATPAIDFYQENIIDLSQSARGLGDLEISARYQLFRRALVGALELALKTPTGYDPPVGTFGDRPRSEEEFVANVGTFVRPENVRDDVTLGDGQLDASVGLLLGFAARTGTFARLDTAYRLRFGDAADQVVGHARIGQLLLGRLLVFGGVDAEIAVTEGGIIGVSVAAEDPGLPAAEYGGFANLALRELRLERDRVGLAAGAILRLTDVVELNGAYGHVIWGRNTAVSRTVSLGVGVRTSLLP
ncbi:MAG: hypothetical protein R3F60_25560 [bacterium]